MDERLIHIAQCYPQLLLPVQAGMRYTEEYKEVVLCGSPCERPLKFNCPQEVRINEEDTPAGKAVIMYLGDRRDFLHAYQALAYRCEPTAIPESVGAVTIRGLINWGKIHSHQEEYLKAGGNDWDEEFARFTGKKENYKDSIILLSGGNYSNVPADETGMDETEWKTKSYIIRKYHELTHFICRGLYPDNIDALRDEVIADCIGLVAALGYYDTNLAKRFLGTVDDVYNGTGRLTHYIGDQPADEMAVFVNRLIETYRIRLSRAKAEEIFELLMEIFP